jgi:hypothetical protein
MKRVTASDARKNWFRLLDEAAAGEIVVIERAGRRLVLRREGGDASDAAIPAYDDLLRAPGASDAERWTWDWDASEGDLRPVRGDDE